MKVIRMLAFSLAVMGMITGCQSQQAANTPPPAENISSPAVAAEQPAQSQTQETQTSTSQPEPPKPIEKQPVKPEEKKPVQPEPKPKEKAPTPSSAPVQAHTAPVKAPVPAPAAPAKNEPVKQQIVLLSIIGDEQTGTILNSVQVVFEEGDTVLDVLKKATKEKHVQMEFRGSGAMAYVEGINNLYEFDRGPKSGWMYRVNGVFGPKSAGAIAIKPNDRIEWLYTLDLGKDLE